MAGETSASDVQIERTRLRYLSEARRAELVACALKDERAQDEILDETVWRRVLASLPSYNRAS
jgi:hypothetical protein